MDSALEGGIKIAEMVLIHTEYTAVILIECPDGNDLLCKTI